MFDWKKMIILCMISLSFISCSITPEMTSQEKQMMKEPVKPYRPASNYRQALANLGVMAGLFGMPSYVVQGKHIMNKTACRDSLPIDITDMVKTAVNTIGDKVQYVVYDQNFNNHKYGDYYRLKGVTSLAPFGVSLPQVVIEGAITECDENLDTKTKSIYGDIMVGGGSTETDVSGAMEKDVSYSRLAMDLHLMVFRTERLIPRKQTSMAVDVWTLEKAHDFGFMISGCGLGIDGRRRVVQGKHNAVRSLVDLSILQLMGRYLELPYWRCIPGGKPDPVVIAMMKEDFLKQSLEGRIGVLQYLLVKCGYNVRITKQVDRLTKLSIQDFVKRNGGSGRIDEQLYVSLMMAVPMPFSYANTASLPPPQTFPEIRPASAPSIVPVPKKTVSRPVSFDATVVYRTSGRGSLKPVREGSVLSSGDYYKIVLKPDQNCYVYIFQADSAGQFYQLYPKSRFGGMTVSSANPMKEKRTYTLPASDKSFVLDSRTGKERIYIAASRNRNRELEVLYSQLKGAKTVKERKNANQNMQRYVAKLRGVAGVTSDQHLKVEWKETGHIFKVMAKRLERIDPDCVYMIEFIHR